MQIIMLIIEKGAAKGCEEKEPIALQAHTDMICEKQKIVIHNFEKDPIILYKDGEYVTADGTTLGADNGIGSKHKILQLF